MIETIKYHIYSIYRKLGTFSILAAGFYFLINRYSNEDIIYSIIGYTLATLAFLGTLIFARRSLSEINISLNTTFKQMENDSFLNESFVSIPYLALCAYLTFPLYETINVYYLIFLNLVLLVYVVKIALIIKESYPKTIFHNHIETDEVDKILETIKYYTIEDLVKYRRCVVRVALFLDTNEDYKVIETLRRFAKDPKSIQVAQYICLKFGAPLFDNPQDYVDTNFFKSIHKATGYKQVLEYLEKINDLELTKEVFKDISKEKDFINFRKELEKERPNSLLSLCESLELGNSLKVSLQTKKALNKI